MWPLKAEIFISLELWQIGPNFQRQICGFRPLRARRSCPRRLRQRPTTGNGNKRFGRQYCHFGLSDVVVIDLLHFHQSRQCRKSRIWCRNFDAFYHTSWGIIISGFCRHFAFSVVDRYWNRPGTFSSTSPWSKSDENLRLECWYLLYFRRHCYFRLSVVFEIIVVKIVIVDSLRFAVKKKQIWRFSQ